MYILCLSETRDPPTCHDLPQPRYLPGLLPIEPVLSLPTLPVLPRRSGIHAMAAGPRVLVGLVPSLSIDGRRPVMMGAVPVGMDVLRCGIQFFDSMGFMVGSVVMGCRWALFCYIRRGRHEALDGQQLTSGLKVRGHMMLCQADLSERWGVRWLLAYKETMAVCSL